ncbi:MAG TPA: DUF2339 domain-containing protein, partial [Xanthomonadales bacterium]|nr:DUF2339 domain-containing protein [Xanthomonadales bacterium]
MIARVVVLVGLAIGWAIPGIPFPLGPCIGGLVAWLLWSHHRQQQRIDELQRQREFDDAVRSATAAAKRDATPAAGPSPTPTPLAGAAQPPPPTPASFSARTSASDDAAVDAFVGDLAGVLSSDASGLVVLGDFGPLGAIVSVDGDVGAEVEKAPDAPDAAARSRVHVPRVRARFEAAAPGSEMRLEPVTRIPPQPPPPVGEPPAAVFAAPAATAEPATPRASTATPSPVAPAPAAPPSPRRTAAAPRPAPPASERGAFALAKRFLTEGNLPVKIGMVLMFFGVAALLKLAYEQGYFDVPVWLQHVIVAALAAAALAFGWAQRTRRRSFALALQGGALGVLLLTL